MGCIRLLRRTPIIRYEAILMSNDLAIKEGGELGELVRQIMDRQEPGQSRVFDIDIDNTNRDSMLLCLVRLHTLE